MCAALGIAYRQLNAVAPLALKDRAHDHALYDIPKTDSFAQIYHKLKRHFDTEVNQRRYHLDYSTLTYDYVRRTNEGKEATEVLEILLDKLRMCHRALGPTQWTERSLVNNVIRACQGVKEFNYALFDPHITFEPLSSSLRSSLILVKSQRSATSAFYTDRRFNRTPGQPQRSKGYGYLVEEAGEVEGQATSPTAVASIEDATYAGKKAVSLRSTRWKSERRHARGSTINRRSVVTVIVTASSLPS